MVIGSHEYLRLKKSSFGADVIRMTYFHLKIRTFQ